MSSENDIWDDILDNRAHDTPVKGPLSERHMYEHSGHRLFCPQCKRFRRTKIEWQRDTPTVMLRITCKTCNTHSDFVVRKDGLVPKWFSDASRRFAMARTRAFLREEVEKDAAD